MTDTRLFAGIPVAGDFTHGNEYREQYGLDRFMPLFNAVVNNAHVKQFGWHQYTPYFNDGDECVFGASSLWVETNEDTIDEEAEDYYGRSEYFDIDYGQSYLAKHEWKDNDRVYTHNEPWVVTLRKDVDALSSALEGGHFDAVLLENFGNHVEVTVFPGPGARIETEFYDHD